MMPFTDLTGLSGSALAMAAACAWLPGAARIRQSLRTPLVGAILIAAQVPLGGLPLAAYVRGVTGDLSITALLLLLFALARFLLPALAERTPAPLPTAGPGYEKDRHALLFLVVLGAAGLYPLALGIGLFDSYRLGYGNPWFLGALLLLALAAWLRGYLLAALCIALAVLAWSGGWHESPNLWDYLLDPLLALYAAGALARQGLRAPPRRKGEKGLTAGSRLT